MAWIVNKRNADERNYSFSVFSGEKYNTIWNFYNYFLFTSAECTSVIYWRSVDDGKSTKCNVSWLGGQCGDWTRRRRSYGFLSLKSAGSLSSSRQNFSRVKNTNSCLRVEFCLWPWTRKLCGVRDPKYLHDARYPPHLLLQRGQDCIWRRTTRLRYNSKYTQYK